MISFLRVPITACLAPICSMTMTATTTNAGCLQHHAQPRRPLYLSHVFAKISYEANVSRRYYLPALSSVLRKILPVLLV
ncbi:hypothetical protein T440DRAFT_26866 [Plenodomus tracheiphilus IPT5]|uniref:Uncharacterized protein n=1 Tax=Plenodomus tracheiphilus IPT5 TaxID=1408161 RepID=A0A6A7AMC2_9PLEO|nr:hypothetical protein T440DRAFT_26866 [Plenodomus tracheiphilus IPT5]